MSNYKHRCIDKECPFLGQVTSKSCRCHVDERGMMLAHIKKQEGALGIVMMTLTKDCVEYDDIRNCLEVVDAVLNPEMPT